MISNGRTGDGGRWWLGLSPDTELVGLSDKTNI